MRGTRCAAGLVSLLVFAPTLATDATPESILLELQSSARSIQTVPVTGLVLDFWMGELTFDEGKLYLIGGYRETSIEAIFIGSGVFRFSPPDDIESGQLELFTGATAVDEPITAAAFVACRDEVVAAIRALGPAETVSLSAEDPDFERLRKWKEGYERELLGAEIAMLHDALGAPAQGGYFAATLEGEDLGDFLFSIDPAADEPVTLGQFVPLELTDKEERKSRKALHRGQRRGRFIGVEFEELGTFDTWVSSRLIDADGVSLGGTHGFAPRHYGMTVDVAKNGRIEVACNMTLESLSGVHTSALLELDSDLLVSAVHDAAGEPLFHYQQGHHVWVHLGARVPVGESVDIEILYAGTALIKINPRIYSLRNTTGWYPRIGYADRATYEVTFNWPANFHLVASGRTMSAGGSGSSRTSRQRFDQPVGYFSFEMGAYEIEYFDIEDVRVTAAWDPVAKRAGDGLEQRVKQVVGSTLRYYEATFGEYPFEFLTFVTAPRDYAQSLPGFVTLPSDILAGQSVLDQIFRSTDPRLLIAHELAHQWWGHLVSWENYRDQWISEAMASYSASAWAHATFSPGNRPLVDLTAGWQTSLDDRTKSRRTVESLGPLVLGQRLNSSHYPAYLPIVYQKGAVVLNTLAEAFGEEAFLKLLKIVVENGRGTVVSTEKLFEMIEQITGQDLKWFTDRYVYGTGIPSVYYVYRLEDNGDGKWKISIDLKQEASFIHEYKLVRNDGIWDFEITSRRMFDTESGLLAIPVQIRVKQKDDKKSDKKKKRMSNKEMMGELARALAGKRGADEKVAEGKIIFRGTEDTVEFEVPFEPEAVWLDRRSDVCGKFYDASMWPRSALERQAIAAEYDEDFEEGIDLYQRALDAEYYVPLDDDEEETDIYEEATERSVVRLRVSLAEMYLRAGDPDGARRELDRAEALPKKTRRAYRERIDIARSRIDLAGGNYRAILDRLKKQLRGRDRLRRIEGYAVLAVSAHELGEDAVYEKAAKIAEKNGVDVTVLKDLREGNN